MKSEKGFTLIELLVVVAIIGILASVVLASLNTARTKARDARRKADIKQIANALALHFSTYGNFTQPEACGEDNSFGIQTSGSCGTVGGTGDWDVGSDLRDLITNGFMSTLPKDPVNNNTYKYTYEVFNAGEAGYGPAGLAYDLCATLEAGGTFCVNQR